jgi:hypothetical protein
MEVVKWLENMDKGEMSRYIQILIREDMKGHKEGLTREDVIKIIREFGSWFKNGSKDKVENDEKLKKAVKGLMDW